MRPPRRAGAPLLRRDPGADRLAPLRPFGVETWVQATPRLVALRPARRRRHPGDAEPVTRSRERRGRSRAAPRPGGARVRRAAGDALTSPQLISATSSSVPISPASSTRQIAAIESW
jgi:hypothetical protein